MILVLCYELYTKHVKFEIIRLETWDSDPWSELAQAPKLPDSAEAHIILGKNFRSFPLLFQACTGRLSLTRPRPLPSTFFQYIITDYPTVGAMLSETPRELLSEVHRKYRNTVFPYLCSINVGSYLTNTMHILRHDFQIKKRIS